MTFLPTCSFTLPSVYDNTQLDCRLYHPSQHQRHRRNISDISNQSKKGAIIAHPYAPLGGCYDDPIVNAVGVELLSAGYIVGTLNFRGAGGSAGRTSWTGRAELADYISLYGFIIHYISGLDTSSEKYVSTDSDMEASTSQEKERKVSTPPVENPGRIDILLCGYSYGSMIASYLPPIHAVLGLFANAENGSATSEILEKSMELSALRNMQVQPKSLSQMSSSQSDDSMLHESFYSLSMGSGSDSGGKRSGKRWTEGFESSLERSRRKVRARFHHQRVGSEVSSTSLITCTSDMLIPTVSYLLISPILPPISSFATLSLFSSRTNMDTMADGKSVVSGKPEEQLTTHKTLAVYGGNDIFTSVKKLRNWSADLMNNPSSQFEYREVESAGHFWHETGTEGEMRRVVRDYGVSIGAGED